MTQKGRFWFIIECKKRFVTGIGFYFIDRDFKISCKLLTVLPNAIEVNINAVFILRFEVMFVNLQLQGLVLSSHFLARGCIFNL